MQSLGRLSDWLFLYYTRFEGNLCPISLGNCAKLLWEIVPNLQVKRSTFSRQGRKVSINPVSPDTEPYAIKPITQAFHWAGGLTPSTISAQS